MPIDYAKTLEKKSLDADLYKTELEKHMAEIPLYSTPAGSTTVLIALGCLALGFAIGVGSR